jgi:hypothetical protein
MWRNAAAPGVFLERERLLQSGRNQLAVSAVA